MIEHSGIGVYIQSIYHLVIKETPNVNCILLIDDKINYSNYFNIDDYNCVSISSPIYSLREQIEIPFKLGSDIDLYWSPHYIFPFLLRAKFLLTIHDIYHFIDKSLYKIFRRFYAKIFFYLIKKMSIHTICVSEFTKRELLDKFNMDTNIIDVVYNGIDNFDKTEPEIDYKLNNIILYVGNSKKHKNVEILIKAYKKINQRTDFKLYLIGNFNFKILSKNIRKSIDNDSNIVHLPSMKRDKLFSYYNKSRLLVLPSIYEGFGFPPLEAVLCGCPALLSDIPVLKEINSDGAYYFRNNNIDSLVGKINLLLENHTITDEVLRKGQINLQKYSWEKSASKTAAIIKNQLSL